MINTARHSLKYSEDALYIESMLDGINKFADLGNTESIWNKVTSTQTKLVSIVPSILDDGTICDEFECIMSITDACDASQREMIVKILTDDYPTQIALIDTNFLSVDEMLLSLITCMRLLGIYEKNTRVIIFPVLLFVNKELQERALSCNRTVAYSQYPKWVYDDADYYDEDFHIGMYEDLPSVDGSKESNIDNAYAISLERHKLHNCHSTVSHIIRSTAYDVSANMMPLFFMSPYEASKLLYRIAGHAADGVIPQTEGLIEDDSLSNCQNMRLTFKDKKQAEQYSDERYAIYQSGIMIEQIWETLIRKYVSDIHNTEYEDAEMRKALSEIKYAVMQKAPYTVDTITKSMMIIADRIGAIKVFEAIAKGLSPDDLIDA